MSVASYTAQHVAELLGLKPAQANGKPEWHGANPTGNGATHDGFILYPEGNAFDRRANIKYTSRDVAKMVGLRPEEYEPCLQHKVQSTITSSRSHSFKLTDPKNSNTQSEGKTPRSATSKSRSLFNWNKARIFEYHDPHGALLFRVGRIDHPDGGKDFRQQQPDGKGGWINNLDGVQRLPFNLPDLLEAEDVIFCEGEQVAETINEDLKAAGIYGSTVATTTAQGSSSLHKTDITSLRGKNIVILPDNDGPGEKYRDAILQELGNYCAIKIIELPNRGDGGDYIDFRRAGGSLDDLVVLVDAKPEWIPPKPKQDFNTYTFKDLALLPQRKSLIRGLLYEGNSSVLSGDSGTFKSFIALDMALCIATGREFHGREVKQGPVVYVAAEGFHTMRERALGWSIVRDCELPENFHILDAPVAILNDVELAKFANQIAQHEPVLIVLDTLSQCAAGANENDNGEMARFVGGMMSLARRIGSHVQTLHHNAKSTGTLRGASSIKANIDTQISLERDEDKQSNIVYVHCEKQRARPFEPFTLRGEIVSLPIEDEFGDTIDTLVFEECGEAAANKKEKSTKAKQSERTREKLLEIFDQVAIDGAPYGGVKVGFWWGAVEKIDPPICSKRTFYEHRNQIEESGLIEECGTHKGSSLFRRTNSSAVSANHAKIIICTNCNKPIGEHEMRCSWCNNPLGVAPSAPIAAMAKKTTQSKRRKSEIDSEPYQASNNELEEGEI